MTYIMSCVWLDYMVKYFQCKNCVGSSLKTKKCVASFLVPGDTPNGSQTLDIAGFAGFSLCSIFLCMSLAHQQICRFRADFRRDIGGT